MTAVIGSACVGRGRRFHGGQSNVETAAILVALPPGTPMVGMFAIGALDSALQTQGAMLTMLHVAFDVCSARCM